MNSPAEPVDAPTPQDLAAFGDREGLARRYAEFLRHEGITRGLIGPREHDRIWSRHVMNSVAVSSLIPPRARVVDLGSGAGLPGIPLALARPDLSVTLVDVKARSVTFLQECRVALAAMPDKPPRRQLFDVARAHVETLRPRSIPVAVTRAFAPLERLLPLMQRLLTEDGMFITLKGSGVATDIADVDQARFELAVIPCAVADSHHTVALVGRRAGRRWAATKPSSSGGGR